MEDDNYKYLLLLLGAYMMLRIIKKRRQKKTIKDKRWWVRPWILRRDELGEYARLLRELERDDRESFKAYMRMTPEEFMAICDRVGPRLKKQDTNWRKALEPGLKLAATIRFLAVGKSLKEQHFSYRLGLSTMSNFLPEVCQAIVDEYADEVLPLPDTPEKWKTVANDFERKWNLPHCIGAIDGKHIAIQNPPKAGSLYYNYKGFYSMVLMAVVDANYRFLYINVGATGAGSDGGVFAKTRLRQQLEEDTLGLPGAEPITADGPEVPYFLVGDEAFPLKTWLMKPVPRRNLTFNERIYNYRISRARRVVENAFGILANKWRCLLFKLSLKPDRIPVVVTACCILHNLLIANRLRDEANLVDRENAQHQVIDGGWRENETIMEPLDPLRGSQMTQAAKIQRQYLVDYVNSEDGAVPWQEDII